MLASTGVIGVLLDDRKIAARMPDIEAGLEPDGWARAGALFDTLSPEELAATPGPALLHRLFHEEAPEVMLQKGLAFQCSCSRERVAAMLQSLGEEEALAAARDGEVEIQCGFCGRFYHFPLAEIGVLFGLPPANVPAPDRLQ